MNTELFDQKIKNIKQLFEELSKASCLKPSEYIYQKISNKISGIYVFSECFDGKEDCYYVGQSNSIFDRLREHCATRTVEKANFAYKMTVDLTNLKPIPGSPNSTKMSMFYLSEFQGKFDEVISRIKEMDYRWIEVGDKLKKNLLEIYASVVLESKYNDFK